MQKIPCFVVVYHDFDVIRASVDFLLKYRKDLDIIVMENYSPNTANAIKPYLQSLAESGSICRYYLFDRNISINASEVVMDDLASLIRCRPFVLFTDGDLVVEQDDKWLEEEMEILEKHVDVGICTVRLDLSNLPVCAFPNAKNWISRIIEHNDYGELAGHTGIQLMLMRSHEFLQFREYQKKHGLWIRDASMKDFCANVLGKKWAVTKHSRVRHLTWDLYQDLEHPYTRMRSSRTLKDTWAHNRYSSYTLYRGRVQTRHVPWKQMIRGGRRAVMRKISELWQFAVCKLRLGSKPDGTSGK